VLSVHFQNEWIAIVTLVGLATILCAARVFGHVELALVTSSVRRTTANGWSRSRSAEKPTIVESRVRLQGTHHWETFWSGLVESADRLGLVSIELSVHLPAMEEGYYACWQYPGEHRREFTWTISVPLGLQGQSVGRLLLSGVSPPDGSLTPLSNVVDFVEPIPGQLERLAATMSRRIPGHAPLPRDPAGGTLGESTYVATR
jgi:hypothetical protein